MNKYSEATIEKAINMEFEVKNGTYFTEPTTEDDVYKHKIKWDNKRGPVCGCKWSQINLKKGLDRKLCSHALGVLLIKNKNDFWKEVSGGQNGC